MAETVRARRYYLLKRFAARDAGDNNLALTWRAEQEAQPGTDLPAGFPSKGALEAVGYTALEDVDGADWQELQVEAQLNQRQAEAAIAAAADLI